MGLTPVDDGERRGADDAKIDGAGPDEAIGAKRNVSALRPAFTFATKAETRYRSDAAHAREERHHLRAIHAAADRPPGSFGSTFERVEESGDRRGCVGVDVGLACEAVGTQFDPTVVEVFLALRGEVWSPPATPELLAS